MGKTNPNLSSVSLDGIFQAALNPGYGIGINQAVVAETGPSTGQVQVPQSQSGTGVFTGVINTAAQWLGEIFKSSSGNTGINPPIIQTTTAGTVPGSTAVATLPGGITISLPGGTGAPVTTNTTEKSFSVKDIPWWGWALGGLVIVVVLFGKTIKKFFR